MTVRSLVIGVNKMSNNIVQQLVDGQAKIDRMRKEVEMLVHMMLGLLHLDRTDPLFKKPTLLKVYESSKCVWTISSWPTDKTLAAECMIAFAGGYMGGYTTLKGSFPFNYDSVGRVHDCLPEFIEGMFTHFPELEDRVRPLLDAAASKQ